jgi:magnesium-transporting ATPase (P-type)
VVATGDFTEIGKINSLVNKVEKKRTNVLRQIDLIAKYLAVAIAIAAAATWAVAFFVAKQSGIDALSTALVCAVAMIPAGLEALVTMVCSRFYYFFGLLFIPCFIRFRLTLVKDLRLGRE